MSVTKDGRRRPQLRLHEQGPAPPGDLPGRRRRDHGRRGGRQRQPQRDAQHPGQLQRGHHRLGARRHGRATRWARREPVLLVGRLRQGRHVRRLQQLRRTTSTSSPRANASCRRSPAARYAYMSGTSMAAPTVAGAVALYKSSRPYATPAEVREALRYLGNLELEGLDRPGSDPRAAARRVPHRAARDVRADPGRPRPARPPRAARPVGRAVHGPAQRDVLRARAAVDHVAARRAGPATLTTTSLMGWTATARPGQRSRSRADTPAGTYQIGVRGTNQGRTVDGDDPGHRRRGRPDREPADDHVVRRRDRRWADHGQDPRHVAGRDRPVQPRSPATRSSAASNGGAWGVDRRPVRARPLTRDLHARLRHDLPVPRPRRRRGRPLEPVGRMAGRAGIHAFDDRSSRVVRQRRRGTRCRARRRVHEDPDRIDEGDREAVDDVHRAQRRGRRPEGPAPRQRTIFIDGVVQKTVSLKSSTSLSRQVVFSWYFADGAAPHDRDRARPARRPTSRSGSTPFVVGR